MWDAEVLISVAVLFGMLSESVLYGVIGLILTRYVMKDVLLIIERRREYASMIQSDNMEASNAHYHLRSLHDKKYLCPFRLYKIT